jgi:hypothetical protein
MRLVFDVRLEYQVQSALHQLLADQQVRNVMVLLNDQ